MCVNVKRCRWQRCTLRTGRLQFIILFDIDDIECVPHHTHIHPFYFYGNFPFIFYLWWPVCRLRFILYLVACIQCAFTLYTGYEIVCHIYFVDIEMNRFESWVILVASERAEEKYSRFSSAPLFCLEIAFKCNESLNISCLDHVTACFYQTYIQNISWTRNRVMSWNKCDAKSPPSSAKYLF